MRDACFHVEIVANNNGKKNYQPELREMWNKSREEKNRSLLRVVTIRYTYKFKLKVCVFRLTLSIQFSR